MSSELLFAQKDTLTSTVYNFKNLAKIEDENRISTSIIKPTSTKFLESLTTRPMVIFVTAYSNYAVESYELDVTASLGVAGRDENTPSLEVLLNRADQAMYVAKHNGRNRINRST